MLLWLAARSRWNSVTVGLASASFCRIASASSVSDRERLACRRSRSSDWPRSKLRFGQASQGFGAGVAVGLEAVAEGAEEGQRLLQEPLAQGFESRVFFNSGSLAMASRNFFTASIAWASRSSARLRCSSRALFAAVEFAVLAVEVIAGLRLHGRDGAQADQPHQQRRGGGGDRGSIPFRPAAGSFGERLAQGRDRLVGQPGFDVGGEGSGRGIAVFGLRAPGPSGRRLPGPRGPRGGPGAAA